MGTFASTCAPRNGTKGAVAKREALHITENPEIKKTPSDDNDNFLYPSCYKGHLDTVMITNDELRSRAAELAQIIHEDYAHTCPILLCVLKGASVFFHELMQQLTQMKQVYQYQFIRASSYEGTESTEEVHISGISSSDFKSLNGKHVILVEDIVDTGVTLSRVIPELKRKASPATVEVCTLLVKRLDGERLEKQVSSKIVPKYVGFSIPNLFIIGYGLDFNEMYRDLNDIWIISEEGIKNGGNLSL